MFVMFVIPSEKHLDERVEVLTSDSGRNDEATRSLTIYLGEDLEFVVRTFAVSGQAGDNIVIHSDEHEEIEYHSAVGRASCGWVSLCY